MSELQNSCLPSTFFNDMPRMRIILCLILAAIQITEAAAHTGDDVGAASVVWQAGTIVPEEEVRCTGTDNWFRAEKISDAVFSRMWNKSWKPDCPLKRDDLRYLRMLHRNAEGRPQRGEMIVNAAIADKVLHIFRRLYEAGYRIERMVLIDEYDADEEKSMNANNTSAFNFRFMTGSRTRISYHERGLAIDLNPLYNPYVKRRSDGKYHVEPSKGRPYAFDRATRKDIPYRIDRNDLAYKLFTNAGFRWGGNWRTLKDYQHFEAPWKMKNEE